MISGQIGEGQAVVTKRDAPSKFVTITQGSARFFGSYDESPNGVYLVAFVDGHLERIGNEEKWVDGQACLVKDLKNVLWSRRLGRPNDGAVSNNGRVAINDWLRMKQTLGGKFYVFDQSGMLLIEKEFNSNLATCAISPEGSYAVVSTAFPDNSIHFFDIENDELKWSYKNHIREVVLGLSISDDKIQVWTGKTVATRKYDYSLNFEGKLSEEDVEKLKEIRTISEGQIEDSINMLIEFLRSPDKNQVLKGLKELRSLTYRFRKYERELTPHVSSHLLDEDEEISQLSEDIILRLGEKDPDAIDTAVQTIFRRIEERPSKYPENDLRTLGMLGKIKPQWVKSKVPEIIKDLKESKRWNARRFAAIALGMIGSVDPDSVKESVPILTKYLGDAGWWLPKIIDLAKEDKDVAADLLSAQMLGVDPEVWMKDAAIGALGDIGEKNPDILKDTMPALISCLRRPQPYTRKKAVVTLGRIAKKDGTYVELAIPILEEISKKDPDDKVKLEAKRILESISPHAAELSVSSIPQLIASLSSEDKIIRYKSIRELERMFYARPSLPEEYYHKALLLMNQSSLDLVRCIEKIKEELGVSSDETTRLLLLESLLMAKRTFLEFIVGEYISGDSLRCKFCGKVCKASGIRNHLSRTHPEKWNMIRPYTDDILQHLESKNQSGLSAEEWERQLLKQYENISRKPE